MPTSQALQAQRSWRSFSSREVPTERHSTLTCLKAVREEPANSQQAPQAATRPQPHQQVPGSGVRPRVNAQSAEELDRISAFASLYAGLRRDLDVVLPPNRTLVLTGRIPENVDELGVRMLRLVNGPSRVEDVIELSCVDKARAVAVLCSLIAAGAMTLA